MHLEVAIPGLLRDCTGGAARVTVEATTISDALDRLLGAWPLLRVHLFDETGRLRRHVLIFHNQDSIARLPHLDVPLRHGDRLQIIQAVSGG